VGDWRNYFSRTQEERFDAEWERKANVSPDDLEKKTGDKGQKKAGAT